MVDRPESVASLILSNSFASVPALAAGWSRRFAELPAAVAAALRDPSNPGAYGAALGEFIARFVLPFAPPEPMIRSQMHSGSDVYVRMHGSSWFSPDGVLSDFDVTDRLSDIAVPTLVVGGVRDQCVPELAETMAREIPGAELAILDTAHLPFYERPDEYFALLGQFLDRVDNA